MLLQIAGTLKFAPQLLTKKHLAQTWKEYAMIETNCELDLYYAWFLAKRFNLVLNKSLRGSHVTIISDRINQDAFKTAIKKYDGRPITFYIDTEPVSNGTHWWLRVYCPEADAIRTDIGLKKIIHGLPFNNRSCNHKESGA